MGRRILSTVFICAAVVTLLSVAVPRSAGSTEEELYPFAYSSELYGHLPAGVWSYGGSLTVFAFDDSTDVEVIELVTGYVLVQGIIGKWEVLSVSLDPGQAFKAVSDRPVSALLVSSGASICPGMSFVPSRGNEGKEFVLDFPQRAPGWGLPYSHSLTIFAWEEADVVVTDASSNQIVWEGHLDPGHHQKLSPPQGRYVVNGSGVLTVELLSAYDSSSFVLDGDQDGCGQEFMFHVFSLGLGYGRHSYYEVHAFEDVFVTVYNVDNPSSPILFDEFTLSKGEHYVRTFDYYDNVCRIQSTGKVSVMAGSYQTDIGGVQGPQSIGDLYTSVPSFNGEGRRFLLGLHCPNTRFYESGFAVIAAEDTTVISVEGNIYELDSGQWLWVAQPDTGVVYYEVLSDKPIHIFTGSIGGDNDFDNIMTYLSGWGESVETCDPVEPPQVRTQGYWRRQCKDDGHEDICAHVDSVHVLADLFDAFDCDSICDLMSVDPPENDMCRKARRQFMALLLNVASGKLAVCNCLDDGREVVDAIAEVDSLLSGSPDHATCVYAKTLADDINNGISLVPCDSLFAPFPPKSVLPLSCFSAPNPFINRATIGYELSASAHVRVRVYDRMGRLVRVLVDGEQGSGSHLLYWDGADQVGGKVPTGIYFYRFEAGSSSAVGKLISLR
ncbi:MAG: FlgD immunoglobulin-like domain containing protein [bacterium]